MPYFRRALAIAQDAGDDAEAGRAMTNLQATFSNEYRLAEAEQVFVEGMRYCEVRDMSTYEHCLRGGHGDALNRMGRWDEVDELLTFDLSERELSPVNKISKLIVKGIIDTRRGRPGAAALLDEALAYVEAGFEPAYELIVGNVRLEAAWLAGDAEGMRREAQRAVPHADKQDPWEKGWLAAWLRRCGLPTLDLDGVAPPWVALLTGDWRGLWPLESRRIAAPRNCNRGRARWRHHEHQRHSDGWSERHFQLGRQCATEVGLDRIQMEAR